MSFQELNQSRLKLSVLAWDQASIWIIAKKQILLIYIYHIAQRILDLEMYNFKIEFYFKILSTSIKNGRETSESLMSLFFE